jgi:hypothetical protein
MKLRRMREARHIAYMGEKSNKDFCGEARKKEITRNT